jgi:CubicO group peptidase (beta-lactamase class C family)
MVSDANERVRLLLEKIVSTGEETGLQVAAYHKGRLVIDAWAGDADAATGRKVDGETLFTVFSTTKGIIYAAIHLLSERGRLSYDDPVTRFWPEFGARGKQKVTVGQVMDHSAGVPQMPDGATAEDICDWDRICAAIAELPPLWEPGTKTGYHAFTVGWILGEVVRRIDGRSAARFVQEEICAPLGLKNLFLGITDDVEPRVANLVDAPQPADAAARPALFEKAIPAALPAAASLFNRPEVRRASIPGAGGIMNARDLARLYASMAGGVDGVRLLPASRVALMARERRHDMDQVLGLEIRKGLGYFLPGPNAESIPDSPGAFGHPGAGGSVGWADPAHGLAVGFAKTLLVSPPDRWAATDVKITRKIQEVLGIS